MNRLFEKRASMTAALIGVIASLVSATILFTSGKVTSIKIGDALQIEGALDKKHSIDYLELEEEITSIKNSISSITALPEDVALSTELATLRASVEKIEKDIAVINEAILESPEKALSIPLLKKEVEALKVQNKNTVESLEREIGSAYEIIRWVLGTIVLGILGIAASVFISSRDKSNA